MSQATRIYAAAKDAFGVPEVYKAWPTVSDCYEALLWDKYNFLVGPLNRKQLSILEDHIIECLEKAKTAPNPYASFRFHMNAAITDPSLQTRVAAAADRREVSLPDELITLQEIPFEMEQ